MSQSQIQQVLAGKSSTVKRRDTKADHFGCRSPQQPKDAEAQPVFSTPHQVDPVTFCANSWYLSSVKVVLEYTAK